MSEGVRNFAIFEDDWPPDCHAAYFSVETGPDKKVTYGFFGDRDPLRALDAEAVADELTNAAGWIRGEGQHITAYELWRAVGLTNPRNKAAGSVGGTTAVANMTREERRARARKGGNQVFHGDTDGSDGVRASARGRLLARKRWRRR